MGKESPFSQESPIKSQAIEDIVEIEESTAEDYAACNGIHSEDSSPYKTLLNEEELTDLQKTAFIHNIVEEILSNSEKLLQDLQEQETPNPFPSINQELPEEVSQESNENDFSEAKHVDTKTSGSPASNSPIRKAESIELDLPTSPERDVLDSDVSDRYLTPTELNAEPLDKRSDRPNVNSGEDEDVDGVVSKCEELSLEDAQESCNTEPEDCADDHRVPVDDVSVCEESCAIVDEGKFLLFHQHFFKIKAQCSVARTYKKCFLPNSFLFLCLFSVGP